MFFGMNGPQRRSFATLVFLVSAAISGYPTPAKPDESRVLSPSPAQHARTDEDGVTPLMQAARDGERWKLDQLFGSADLNARDAYGWTALMYSTKKGDLSILTSLLAKGANPNVKDETGNTALMFAAEEGNIEQVKALLRTAP